MRRGAVSIAKVRSSIVHCQIMLLIPVSMGYMKRGEQREAPTVSAVKRHVVDDAYRGVMQGGAAIHLRLGCRGR